MSKQAEWVTTALLESTDDPNEYIVLRVGEPQPTWPEGFYYNARTGELASVFVHFNRKIVHRGAAGTTETPVEPGDTWRPLERKA